jgi:hypothetical protein
MASLPPGVIDWTNDGSCLLDFSPNHRPVISSFSHFALPIPYLHLSSALAFSQENRYIFLPDL